MIIDIHTHIFPDEIRNGRSGFFSYESAFELLYGPANSKMVGADEMVKMMDEENVDKAVVFGFPWKDPGVMKMHNDYVLDAVKRFSDRLIGFSCLAPKTPGAEKEVARCLDGGLKGVGELAFYESGIDDACLDALAPLMKQVEEAGYPIMIHTNEPVGHIYPGKAPMTLKEIYNLCKRFPDNKIILAHWGGGVFFFNLLKKEVKDVLKNVWYDTAASPYLYDTGIYPAALQYAGENKVLFGSDYPLIKPGRYIKDMKVSGITEVELEAVLGKNAEMLLKDM